MALNFNADPYYDDFDPDKNYHRILFKPEFAVQARELTQSQTILQDQITKFADHIFQKNTPVNGAKISINTSCWYLKLNTSFDGVILDMSNFEGKIIQNFNGDIVAKVIASVEPTGSDGLTGDPPTLIVTYLSGQRFVDSDTIYVTSNRNVAAQLASTDSTGLSSAVSISAGVFYVVNGFSISQTTGSKFSLGHFVNVLAQTTPLEKYTNNPTLRAGLNITETIYDHIDDVALLDPADGAPNYQGPGADRFVIKLTLETRPISLGDDDGFIELVRLKNGVVESQVNSTAYSTIDDYIAKRTYDTNGDYIVSDFKLTPTANSVSNSVYDIGISKGVAYVRGYRIENQSTHTLTNDRSRTFESVNNNQVYVNYGNYFYVNTSNGFFDITKSQSIDLHLSDRANIVSTNANTYNRSVVGTARIRGFDFDRYGTIGDSNTYVYKAFVHDIVNKTLSANVLSATANTIVLPGLDFSSANDAYKGVTVTIDAGKSVGDRRTITNWDGSIRTATVDTDFSVVPDTTSVAVLRFAIADIESIVVKDGSYNQIASAAIDVTGKDNTLSTGNTVLQDPEDPALLYNIGTAWVKNISDGSYDTTYVFQNQSFSGGAVTLSFVPSDNLRFAPGDDKDNFIIVHSSGNTVNNVTLTSAAITNGGNTATLTTSLGSFTGTVFAKSYTPNATDGATSRILKIKTVVLADNAAVHLAGTQIDSSNVWVDTTYGQAYIWNDMVVAPGSAQKLYVSDVRNIVKIIDTKSPTTVPTSAMLTDSSYDVTKNFAFDTGQRDSYYDHASIQLLPGRPKIQGRLLVLFDHYAHSGGDGYFAGISYLAPKSSSPETYGLIPSYVSSYGVLYKLRDCLDFRPVVKNLQSEFIFRYNNISIPQVFIPTDASTFTLDYDYYLYRNDKLILTKDKSFQLIQGVPSLNPVYPVEPDGALVLANIRHNAYTAFVQGELSGVPPDMSIERVSHRRWTMKDISGLQSRVNNIEYYTAINTLEKSAQGLQVPDVNGINRYKNGILVDDFSSFATADSSNLDFNCSINKRIRKLAPSYTIDNISIQNTDVLATFGKISDATLDYRIDNIAKASRTYSLPYTTVTVASQTLASNTMNINQFSNPIYQGIVELTPSMDNWVDNTKSPDLVIIDPNASFLQPGSTLNTLNVSDWKVIPGTEIDKTSSTTVSSTSTTSKPGTTSYYGGWGWGWGGYGYNNYWNMNGNWNWGGYGVATTGGSSTTSTTSTTTSKTDTYADLSQTTTTGYYDTLGSTITTGNYITDISVQPWIRPQEISIHAMGLSINTPIHCFFDGIIVDDFIKLPDIIELTDVEGTFEDNDVVGYTDIDNTFIVIGTTSRSRHDKTNKTVRLHLHDRYHDLVNTYSALVSNRIHNARWNKTGTFVGNTAYGQVSSSNAVLSLHQSGHITSVGGTYTDANANVNNLIKTSSGAWHPDLNKGGIWFANNVTSNTAAWNVAFSVTGTHTIAFAGEDYGTVNVGGTLITLLDDTSTPMTAGNKKSWQKVHNGTLSVSTINTKKVEIFASNSTGRSQGGFYCVIKDPTGKIVFNTANHQKYANTQSLVSTKTEMYGGGHYYTGVTKLRLSSLASNTTNYYVGSKIIFNSVNVSQKSNPVNNLNGQNIQTDDAIISRRTMVANVVTYSATTKEVTLDASVDISYGFNSVINGDVTSEYTINGLNKNLIVANITNTSPPTLSTDDRGEFSGIFHIPPNAFKTGERIFRIDNRTVISDDTTYDTIAQGTFAASGLSTKSQAIEFSAGWDSLKGLVSSTATKTNQLIDSKSVTSTSTANATSTTPPVYRPYYYWPYAWNCPWFDPLAQTFIIDKVTYPNGLFLKDVKLFFKSKPIDTVTPVKLSIVGTLNGYPNGETLDHSVVVLTPDKVNISDTPHHGDANTVTTFDFPSPVYIQPGVLYSLVLMSESTDYDIYIASKNSVVIPSTAKDLYTDTNPTNPVKVGVAPYVGSLFESQNGMTWTADQGKAMMFVLDRCLFDIESNPKIQFVTPKNLPYRRGVVQDMRMYLDANNVSNLNGSHVGQSLVSHAMNVTVTDFTPTQTKVSYTYDTKLSSGGLAGESNINPGKYGTPSYDDIFFGDGRGNRFLDANSNSGFLLYATLSSEDDAVSPIVSDDGLTLFNVRYNINDMELQNTIITVVSGGTGYNANAISVYVSPPDESSGTQAYAVANLSGNVVSSVYFTNTGSGYIKTPVITVLDANSRSGNTNTSIIVHGETSTTGGNGLAKYFTKKVVLAAGNDSGDLRVFYDGYRPFGSNIYVYYKILNKNDSQSFEDGTWQLMTTMAGRHSYSGAPNSLIEFEAAPGINGVANDEISYTSTEGTTYNEFNQYAIKIVMATNDPTNPPWLTDLRVLALPSGTGL